MAISLWALPADAAPGLPAQFVQNAPDAGQGAAGQQGAVDATAVPVNTAEQVKKAQIELKRLDCLNGRIDGKLGASTRDALKKFWTMAKQDIVEVRVTDALIADLAERGDNYCRPKRRFFGFGGRPTMTAPFFAPGARPPGLQAPVPQPQPPPPN
jgi:peptidoglycan hydrolase-like protein with peptidoglycan-binding domain